MAPNSWEFYPSGRDAVIKSAEQWMDTKRDDDNLGKGIWSLFHQSLIMLYFKRLGHFEKKIQSSKVKRSNFLDMAPLKMVGDTDFRRIHDKIYNLTEFASKEI